MSQPLHTGAAARRYARALFELARDQDELAAVRESVTSLGQVVRIGDVREVLLDPRLPVARKRALLARLLPDDLHRRIQALLEVVAKRNRLAVLVEIPAAFEALLDTHEGRLRGTVESAQELAAEQLQSIESALSARTGCQVSLQPQVVEELLGGIRVTLSGTRFDGSARGRLDALRTRLASADIG